MQEQDLIARSQTGDLDAFNRLVELYQTQVFNLAFRIVGSMGPAEDAAQESFISAFRAIHTFRGGSFRGWLMRIVTNAAYDQLRAVQRRPAAAQSALAPQAAPAPLAADGGTTERSLATEADAPVAAEIEAAVEPPAAAIPAQRFPWLALEIAAGALMALAMTATFRLYRRSRASSGGGQSEYTGTQDQEDKRVQRKNRKGIGHRDHGRCSGTGGHGLLRRVRRLSDARAGSARWRANGGG